MDKEKTEDKNVHAGHRERMRKMVFETKLKGFSEYQVLEYLLSFIIARKDTNPIAHDLLDKFGNLKNILNANPNELIKVNNIGKHTASFLNSLPIVFEYYNIKYECLQKECLATPLKIATFSRPYFRNCNCEKVMIIITDGKANSLSQQVFTAESRSMVTFKMTKIISMLDEQNASHFVLVHNHMNESCKPSINDNLATRKVAFSSIANNVKLFDHVILGNDGFFSYRSCGMLDMFESEFEKIFPRT